MHQPTVLTESYSVAAGLPGLTQVRIEQHVTNTLYQLTLNLKCSLYYAASPVDSILDKDKFTLAELLDEDELIQECKSLNARLTAFLKKKETVQQLVRG